MVAEIAVNIVLLQPFSGVSHVYSHFNSNLVIITDIPAVNMCDVKFSAFKSLTSCLLAVISFFHKSFYISMNILNLVIV